MTATAHALVAGAIAARFTDPVTAALLSLTSHYVMDSIPHWDFGTNWRNRPKYKTGMLAIGETVFGIAASYIFFGSNIPTATWIISVGASLIPDWLETPWYILYAKNNKHSPSQNAGFLESVTYAFYKIPNVFHAKAQFPFGVLTQIATVGFFLYILR